MNKDKTAITNVNSNNLYNMPIGFVHAMHSFQEKAIQKYECHRHYLEDDNKCDPRSFKRL